MPEEAKHKPVKYDAGVEQIITDVIGNLLNQYPDFLKVKESGFLHLKKILELHFIRFPAQK